MVDSTREEPPPDRGGGLTGLEALPDLLLEIDPGEVVAAIHGPASLLPRSMTPAVAGAKIAELFPPLAVEILRESLERAAREGESHGAVVEYPAAGGPRWVELSVRRKPARQTGSFLALVRDVTDRRRAEVALERRAKEDAVLTGLSEELLSASTLEETDWLILERARMLTGSPHGFVGHIDPETGFLVSSTLTRDMWEGCRVPRKHFVFEKFAGLWGWVLDHRTSLMTNDPGFDPRSTGVPAGHIPIRRFLSAPALAGGELLGTIALANAEADYSAEDLAIVERLAGLYALAIRRLRAEEGMRRAERRVQEAVGKERQAILIQGLAHEIRNPLFALEVASAAVAEGLERDPESGPLLAAIREQVDRLGRLMRELLELSQVSRERDRSRCRLSDLLRDAISQVPDRTGARRPNIVLRPESGEDAAVRVQPEKIRSALLELLANAVEQSLPGTEVTVSLATIGRRVEVRIVDRGRGLPKELGERIWEPLVTDARGHRGIGLTLARHWIEAHGGEVSALPNEEEPGTTFRLLLPLDEPGALAA